MKIILASNTSWSILNFRSGLIRSLRSSGHEVITTATYDKDINLEESLGVVHFDYPVHRKSINPIKNIKLCLFYFKKFKHINPKYIILYTIKPVIFGSLAAQLLRMNTISIITGLGRVFVHDNWLTRVVESLYRISLSKSKKVFY